MGDDSDSKTDDEGAGNVGLDDFEITIIDDKQSTVTAQPLVPPTLRPEEFHCEKLPVPQPNFVMHKMTAIFVHAKAFRQCIKFAETSLDKEVAGIMVGTYHTHNNLNYLLFTDLMEGEGIKSHIATVVMTHEMWNHIHDTMAARHPDKMIVGWFHTHPRFGIFLSGNDTFIQKNYFPELWLTAMVVDPVKKEYGFFRQDESSLCPEIVIYQEKNAGEPIWRNDPTFKDYLKLDDPNAQPGTGNSIIKNMLKQLGL